MTISGDLPENNRIGLTGTAICITPLVALMGSLAYWPGLVTWDSLRQYDQALSGAFDDWHPPVMEWIWRQALPLAHSPAPMLVLQLALYAAGIGLLVGQTYRHRGPGTALAIGVCALMPIPVALMGTVIKDSLMTGAILTAAGLCWMADNARPRSSLVLRGGAIALCLLAAMLRFNAIFAALPITLWAMPPLLRASKWRMALAALILLPLLLAAMPVANRLIGAQKSGVELSLVIFDLGGMTEHSGENQFPPLGLRDPVAVNHRCYTPVKWDSYSWWVDPICPINFDAVHKSFAVHQLNPQIFWVAAIIHHPLAYMAHRLSHWNINARFLVPDEIERPVQVEAPPNEWGFGITRNPVVRLVDRAALLSADTPLGWPCVWMAALIGLLWTDRTGRLDPPARWLAWSALLYGLEYGIASVASELRYYLWTIIAGAIALVLAIRPRASGEAVIMRRDMIIAMGLPLLVALLCVSARLSHVRLPFFVAA